MVFSSGEKEFVKENKMLWEKLIRLINQKLESHS
jgi:hypothetical protein